MANSTLLPVNEKQVKSLKTKKTIDQTQINEENSKRIFSPTSDSFQPLPVHNHTVHNLKCLTNDFTSIDFEAPDPMQRSNFFISESRKLQEKKRLMNISRVSKASSQRLLDFQTLKA
jgi:hypothetical protein